MLHAPGKTLSEHGGSTVTCLGGRLGPIPAQLLSEAMLVSQDIQGWIPLDPHSHEAPHIP